MANVRNISPPTEEFQRRFVRPSAAMRFPGVACEHRFLVDLTSGLTISSRCNETHYSSTYFGVTCPERTHMPNGYTPLDRPDVTFRESLGAEIR
jgi:hypothetical protein